jgi:hypothetical protein
MSIVEAPRSPLASGFGRKPIDRAASSTRARVSGPIGTGDVVPLRTRETVLWETPAALAISRMVATPSPEEADLLRVASLGTVSPSVPASAAPD